MSRRWHARWVLLWLTAACLTIANAMAQAPQSAKPLRTYFREAWTTREGLPHNQINGIAQTADGYIWLATWEGVVRFNGLQFQVFDRHNTSAIEDNGIRSVDVAQDGSLVVATSRGGVSVLRAGRWRHYGEQDGLIQQETYDALIDRTGRLWVATENSGVVVIDGKRVVHLQSIGKDMPLLRVFDLLLDRNGEVWAAISEGVVHIDGAMRMRLYGAADGLTGLPVQRIAQAPDGSIIAGAEKGAYRLQGQRFVPLAGAPVDDSVPSIAFGGDGSVWLGTVNRGVVRLQGQGVDQFGVDDGLPNNRVPALLIDRDGAIWAGSAAGLLRLRDAPFVTFNTAHGLSDDYARAIVQSRDGSVWIGTSHGLNHWRDDRPLAQYTMQNGLPGDAILSLLEATDGSLWVGTHTSGALQMRDGKVVRQLDDTHGMSVSNQVRALAQDRQGRIWVGTSRGLALVDGDAIRVFGTADGLPRDYIVSLHVAGDGTVWAGTLDGAARLVGDRFQALSLRGLDNASKVFDFLEDPDGTLWMATDRGLIRYRKGQLANIGIEHGLPVDTLFAVRADALGNLWLTSNRGALRVTRANVEGVMSGAARRLSIDTYGEADGMVSSQCNGASQPAAMRDDKGRIWIATARGVSVVRPELLTRYRRTRPPVVLERVLADGQPVPLAPSIRLPVGTKRIELHYVGLYFDQPRAVTYRQRLQGEDPDWINRETQRVSQYTNLKPGTYRYSVVAALPGDGERIDEADATTVELILPPQFWQTLWFRALAVTALVLAVAGYFRWRVGALRQRALVLEQQVDQRTVALREQTERLQQSDAEKTALLEQLHQQSEAFEKQARTDALTGLPNRRDFDERLSAQFEKAARLHQPLSVILFDVDHFKRINDTYSHAAGDDALRAVAEVLRSNCRVYDVVARWGGEEFVMLLPQTSLADARLQAERMRLAVAAIDTAAFAPGLQLHVSGGIAERTGFDHRERLLAKADANLYAAKHGGRNRVVG